MTLRSRAFLAWSLFGLCLLLLAASAVLELAAGRVADRSSWGSETGGALLVVSSLAFPAVGALLASRRAGGAIGWIGIAVGLAVGFVTITGAWAKYTLVAHPGALPGGRYAAWGSSWTWLIFIGLIAIYMVLLFPTGAPPSPRWRPVAWIAGLAIAVGSIGMAFAPGPLEDAPVELNNPVGIEGAKTPLAVLAIAGIVVFFACVLAALASMVVRFRHSSGTERQQLKWFVSATLFTIVLFFSAVTVTALLPDAVASALQSASLVALASIPVAMGVAILTRSACTTSTSSSTRPSSTLSLAAFITAVYIVPGGRDRPGQIGPAGQGGLRAVGPRDRGGRGGVPAGP